MRKLFYVVVGVCKSSVKAAQNPGLLVVLHTAKFLSAQLVVQNPGTYTQPSGTLAQFITTENLPKLHLSLLAFPQFTQPLLKLLRSI